MRLHNLNVIGEKRVNRHSLLQTLATFFHLLAVGQIEALTVQCEVVPVV
jgi:hypothetical protein